MHPYFIQLKGIVSLQDSQILLPPASALHSLQRVIASKISMNSYFLADKSQTKDVVA